MPAAASIQAAKSIAFLIREEPLSSRYPEYPGAKLARINWQNEQDFFEAL
jgi:hypothetical protein